MAFAVELIGFLQLTGRRVDFGFAGDGLHEHGAVPLPGGIAAGFPGVPDGLVMPPGSAFRHGQGTQAIAGIRAVGIAFPFPGNTTGVGHIQGFLRMADGGIMLPGIAFELAQPSQ